MDRILIAEDDLHTNKLLCAVLRKAGHEVLPAANGAQALDLLDCNHVDLLASDVMMPVVDGFELCRQLREAGYELPILLLTAKQPPQDKVAGFTAGTDDYLTKPFDTQELVLRVKALLRRAHIADGRTLTIGPTLLDADVLCITRHGESQTLPPKEFQLAFKFLSNPGKVFTRMQLLDEIWGWDTRSSEATVNVHVNRLRTRFKGWDEFEIQTVRGLGYRAVIHHEA